MIFPPKIIKQKNKNTSRRKAQKKINCQLLGNVLHPRSERETEGINHTFQQQTLSTFAFFFCSLHSSFFSGASTQNKNNSKRTKMANNKSISYTKQRSSRAREKNKRKRRKKRQQKRFQIYFYIFCFVLLSLKNHLQVCVSRFLCWSAFA